MQDIHLDQVTTNPLSLPLLAKKKVEVNVLRLDKIHSLVSGNKWFKLRYYIEEAKAGNKKTIVTWGGAWSNHILATAAASKINGLDCIGIIRGEEPAPLSPTLEQAKQLGMQLIFVSREDYGEKKVPVKLNEPDHYFIPEGGYGKKGATGAATIFELCKKEDYTHICCAAGTGTMTAGLTRGLSPGQQVISISALKNNFGLEEDIKKLLGDHAETQNFVLIHDYHFGGYAKHQPELLDFMNEFYRQTNIPSDFVYTGKLFFAVRDLISKDFFREGSRLLVIHSGGLQGNASLSKGTLIF